MDTNLKQVEILDQKRTALSFDTMKNLVARRKITNKIIALYADGSGEITKFTAIH